MPRTTKPARGKGSAALSADQIDAVLRASRALVGVAAASIAELGDVVTIPQFRVLVMIDTRGPLNLASVADGLDVNPSNASRICDRLIRAGFVDRGEAAVDRRNISLSLTRDGRQLVRRVTGHRRRAIGRVLSVMSREERDAVVAALDVFAAAAGEPHADTPLDVMWPPA